MGRVPKALLALSIAQMLAAPALARPMDEELRNLMVEHPLLRSTRLSVASADHNRAAARAGYYPRVNVTADAGRESITTRSYSGGNITPPIDTDLTRRKAGLVVEQNLYAGGRTDAAVTVAGVDLQLQDSNLQSTTQDVLLEGVTVYVQMARYLTLASLARRNEETTQQQLDLENTRVERGGGIAVDAMAARVRLQLVKERRVFYAQGLREAVANYQQVFGHEPDVRRLQQVGIFYDRIPKTLDEALAQARDLSPRVKEAGLQSQKAQAQIRVERAAYMPTVDLVAAQLKDVNANALARRDESSLLLRLSWPIFSGFETQNRVAAANANHQSLVERETAVNNRLAESVRVAWNQLTNGREREDLLEGAAAISYDVMQSRKRLRDAGRETVIFVLDAEVEYYGALSNRINAMHDSVLASYRLLAAMGALTPATLGLENGSFALPLKPFNPDAAAILR